MSNTPNRILYWTPRAVSIAFVLFLGMFALDVFDGRHGFLETMIALAVHLIPSLLLIAALILAWRWEWIGAVVYGAGGLLYLSEVLPRPLPAAIKASWILCIAGPAILVAALFLANWFKRAELHAGRNAR